jgi:hypothetical protein
MTKKVRISAESLPRLRDFVVSADVDMGCRPVALKRGDRFATTVLSSDEELERLSRRRSVGIEIEVLEEIPPAEARLRMVRTRSGNRFAGGQVPRGLGRKE